MLEKNFNIFSCDRADTHGKKQERFNSIRLLLRGENTHCKVCNVEHINFWWMWQITYFCMEKEKKTLMIACWFMVVFFHIPLQIGGPASEVREWGTGQHLIRGCQPSESSFPEEISPPSGKCFRPYYCLPTRWSPSWCLDYFKWKQRWFSHLWQVCV